MKQNLSQIKNILKELDIIGIKPEFLISGSNRYRTVVGGILRSIIYILMFIAFLHFGQELVFKNYPLEVVSTLFYSNPEDIKIDLNNFYFFFMIINKNHNPISNYTKNSNLTVNINNYNINSKFNNISLSLLKNTNTTVKSNIKPCNRIEGIFNSKTIKLFKDLDLSKYYCPDLISFKNESALKGTDFSNFKRTISLSLKTNSKTIINSEENIPYKLKLFFFISIFSSREFEKVGQTVIQSEEFAINSLLNQQTSIKIQKVIYNTDTGYVFEDYLKETYFKVSKIKNHYTLSPSAQSRKLEISFELSNLVEKKYRKYLKVQSLIVDLGGLSKSLIIIAII